MWLIVWPQYSPWVSNGHLFHINCAESQKKNTENTLKKVV